MKNDISDLIKEIKKIKRGKTYIKIQKVIPKERNIERQYFKLLDKTEQGIFTELQAFKSVNFNTVIDPEQKKAFQENFVKNTKYFDVKVMYTAGKDYCEIVLKTNDGFRKIKAFICDVDDEKINKKQVLKFMKVYKKYNALRYKREQSFNLNNQIRFTEFKAYIKNDFSWNRFSSVNRLNIYLFRGPNGLFCILIGCTAWFRSFSAICPR